MGDDKIDERKKQNADCNKLYPPGWEGMVDTMFKKKKGWRLYEAANLVCGLDPERHSCSQNPENIQPDSEFSSTYYDRPWKLDELELHFWNVFNSAKRAADSGALKTIANKAPNQSKEDFILDGPPRPSPPSENPVNPKVFMIWCYQNIDDIPPILLGRYEVPSQTKQTSEQIIRVLNYRLTTQANREKNLIAILSLIVDSPNEFTRAGKISLERVSLELEDLCENHNASEIFGFEQKSNRIRLRLLRKLINPIRTELKKHIVNKDS